MSFDPTAPNALVVLVPDELRVTGQPGSGPDEVLRVIAHHLYAPEDVEIIAADDPGMRAAAQKSLMDVVMMGGSVPEEIAPLTLRFSLRDDIVIRHVRGLVARPGAVPRTFIDYRKIEQYGLERITSTKLSPDAVKWRERAELVADERAAAEDEAERLRARVEELVETQGALERRLAVFATEAIIVVPEKAETTMEVLRRRVRDLEQLLERAHQELSEPAAAQRERVKLDLACRALRLALGDILAAAAPNNVLTAATTLRWIGDKARAAMAEGARRNAPEQTLPATGISEWVSTAASFCALLASKTGAPHEEECGCQGCAAYHLLEDADRLHIAWTDPNAELLEDAGGTTP